ncbi:MAG: hypothetical protein U0T56_12095 [Ferruginibacter sp.]
MKRRSTVPNTCISIAGTRISCTTEHFPNIYAKCLSIGIDVSKDMILVSYRRTLQLWWVKRIFYGQTSTAISVCFGRMCQHRTARANRLASNSLLEAMVFSHRSYLASVAMIENLTFCRQYT